MGNIQTNEHDSTLFITIQQITRENSNLVSIGGDGRRQFEIETIPTYIIYYNLSTTSSNITFKIDKFDIYNASYNVVDYINAVSGVETVCCCLKRKKHDISKIHIIGNGDDKINELSYRLYDILKRNSRLSEHIKDMIYIDSHKQKMDELNV